MPVLSTLWQIIWGLFSVFVFVAYLLALVAVLIDLFRDHGLSGGAKALWLIFLIFLPVLTVIAYLVVRGQGMGDRSREQSRQTKAATDEYIRSVAAQGNDPAAEIERAKALRDSGVINDQEFEILKAGALRQAN